MSEAMVRRRFALGDVTIAVDAPPEIMTILNLTLARVPTGDDGEVEATVSVRKRDTWEIHRSLDRYVAVLEPQHALPEIAGAVVSAMVAIARSRTNGELLKAVVLEHEGEGLALVGDDWESAVMIGAHLTLRGWRFVSAHYSFVDPPTLRVKPVQKLLAITSTLLPALPLQYRTAVESSRWYSSRDGILFYSTDPHRVLGESVWADGARLRAALIISGATHEHASVETPSPEDIAAYMPASLTNDEALALGAVVLSNPVASADVVERWYAKAQTAVTA